jgi:hypothetical protein
MAYENEMRINQMKQQALKGKRAQVPQIVLRQRRCKEPTE